MPRDGEKISKEKVSIEDLTKFNPEINYQLNGEQVQQMIEEAASRAARKVLDEYKTQQEIEWFVDKTIDRPTYPSYEQPAVNQPRAYTSEEVTEQFLESVAHRIHYWQTQPNCGTMEERVEGVVHSLFAILDGSTLDLPAFDLVPSPHESDKQYSIDQGETITKKKQ